MVAYNPAGVPQTMALAPPGIATLQRLVLWLIGAGGAIVLFEPSPYEIATLLGIIVFGATGFHLPAATLPALFLLFVINLGYTISAADMLDQNQIVNWIITSWYLFATVILFAICLAKQTAERLDMIRRGLIFGAIIASLAGVAGYFNLVPGQYELLTLYSRARGTFKDPNVLGAFLILPALFLLQDVVTARTKRAILAAVLLGIIALAVLLAFSRAAWGQLVVTSAFLLVLMLMTADSLRQRSRIITTTVLAIAAAAALLLVLLSFDSVSDIFSQRASLNQDYDGGRFGRFGRHLLGAQMALDLPLGIGPLQFTRFFPEHTHNSFLNAFMSGGWISGITFPLLLLLTLVMGGRILLVKTPWQKPYLALYAAFVGTVGEAVIIDVDHWRHFWLMLGAVWGVIAATQRYASRNANYRLYDTPMPARTSA